MKGLPAQTFASIYIHMYVHMYIHVRWQNVLKCTYVQEKFGYEPQRLLRPAKNKKIVGSNPHDGRALHWSNKNLQFRYFKINLVYCRVHISEENKLKVA
jgi:hypothetical protein